MQRVAAQLEEMKQVEGVVRGVRDGGDDDDVDMRGADRDVGAGEEILGHNVCENVLKCCSYNPITLFNNLLCVCTCLNLVLYMF